MIESGPDRSRISPSARRLGLVGQASHLFRRARSSEELADGLLTLLVDDGAALAYLRLPDAHGRATICLRHQPASAPERLQALLDADPSFSSICDELSRELATSDEPLLISSAPSAERGLFPAAQELAALVGPLGVSQTVAAPLIRADDPPGLLLVFATSGSSALGEEGCSAIDLLARQAALALDNVRLRDEARAARDDLARQLTFTDAITHDVAEGIIAVDRGGRITYLNPVAEQILGWSIEEVLGRVAHDLFHVRDASGSEMPAGECPVQDVYESDRTLRLDDLFFGRSDGTTFPVALSASPLVRDGETVGAVLVFRDVTDRKAAERHLARLLKLRKVEAEELLALQDRLRRSLGAVLGLHEVGKLLTSAGDPKLAGRRLLEIAVRAASLDAAAISLRDRKGSMRLWQRVDPAGHTQTGRRSPVALSARAVALATGDVKRYLASSGGAGQSPRLGWCVPLVAQDQVVGVLEAVGAMDLFGEPTAEILSSIAAQAASALEISRLYHEIAERERALHPLIHQLMSAQEEERRRLALEMHDDVAQTATGLQQLLEAFAHAHRPGSAAARARLDRAVDLARQSVGAIRRVLAGLRPALLDDLGLARGLVAYAASLRADGLDVSFRESCDLGRLSPALEIALFRVAQEALTNVRKHAGTTRAELSLAASRSRITLEIRDEGRGFDPQLVNGGEADGSRLGLLGMRERIAQIGGTFTLLSRPGQGTCVRIVAPRGGPGSGRLHRPGARR